MTKLIIVAWGLTWLWFVYVYFRATCSEIETWNYHTKLEKMLIILAAMAGMIFLVIMIGIMAVAIAMAWGLGD